MDAHRDESFQQNLANRIAQDAYSVVSIPWQSMVRLELRSYLRWLRAMERALPIHRNQIARTYKGKVLTLHTRVGRDAALQSAPIVCLANINVQREHRRRGFFTCLVEMLDDRSGLLNAEWITVESVHNPWLAKKLDSLGFSRFELSEHSPPSFYRKLRK